MLPTTIRRLLDEVIRERRALGNPPGEPQPANPAGRRVRSESPVTPVQGHGQQTHVNDVALHAPQSGSWQRRAAHGGG